MEGSKRKKRGMEKERCSKERGELSTEGKEGDEHWYSTGREEGANLWGNEECRRK